MDVRDRVTCKGRDGVWVSVLERERLGQCTSARVAVHVVKS